MNILNRGENNISGIKLKPNQQTINYNKDVKQFEFNIIIIESQKSVEVDCDQQQSDEE